jgi:hypothetical protein
MSSTPITHRRMGLFRDSNFPIVSYSGHMAERWPTPGKSPNRIRFRLAVSVGVDVWGCEAFRVGEFLLEAIDAAF